MGREDGHWESWEGGRKWLDREGGATYYIRQRINGRRYQIRTPATTEGAAHEHLKRFRENPDAYDPAGVGPREGLFLGAALAKEFLDHSKAEGNSLAWRRKQKNLLDWWGDRLEGMDVRKPGLLDSHIKPALKRKDATAKHHRIAVLKAFYTWLRTVRSPGIETTEDPVYGRLMAPKGKPAQWSKSKVVPLEHFHLVRDALTAPWRDALVVQGGTGWHTTELLRFAAEGSIEPLPKFMKAEHGAAAVLVCPLHKSGDTHRTAVSQEVLDAAKRLRAHVASMAKERAANIAAADAARATRAGKRAPKEPRDTPVSFSREWYDRAVRSACLTVKCPDGSVGIPPFTPGRMRHSVATWAVEAGADPKAVSAFLGHKSPTTTMRFYASLATVPKVPTLA